MNEESQNAVDGKEEESMVKNSSDDNKEKLRDVGKNNGKPSAIEKFSEGEQSSSDSSDESFKVTSSVMDKLASQLKNVSLPEKILNELSLDGIVKYINEKSCKNIITMVGAGISTAAGIPDFRSPGTGIYHNLKKYKLPYMQAIFELKYFMNNPEPFYQLARELLPGDYKPTKSHYFIKLLEEKGLLLRHYTQNIDNLDRLAGISDEKLIEAHGTFYKSHCVSCRHEYDFEWLKVMLMKRKVPHCIECNSLVKPDIIFFGENLPQKFFEHVATDFKNCDLLIIMGSSLEVEPFASLAMRTKKTCPRLMINATEVGSNINFQFGQNCNQRDVLWIGDCDTGCQELADKLGWGEDLLKLTKSENKEKDCILRNILTKRI